MEPHSSGRILFDIFSSMLARDHSPVLSVSTASLRYEANARVRNAVFALFDPGSQAYG